MLVNAEDEQRSVDFATWILKSLGLVDTIIGTIADNSGPVVQDPVDAILGGDVRVPDR